MYHINNSRKKGDKNSFYTKSGQAARPFDTSNYKVKTLKNSKTSKVKNQANDNIFKNSDNGYYRKYYNTTYTKRPKNSIK